MDLKDYDEMAKTFADEVQDCSDIDPDNNYSWNSLIYGWALGKGLSPADAEYLTKHILFKTIHGEK